MKSFLRTLLLSTAAISLVSSGVAATNTTANSNNTPAAAVNAAANTNAALRVAVIDFRQIMQQSPQAKEAISKLKKEFKPREEKIKKMADSLNKKEDKLKRDAAVLSATDKRNLENEVIAERRDLQREEENYQQDVTMAQDEALQSILEKVAKTITKVAEKSNYQIVLEKSRVPYVSSQLDITQDVLKELS